MSQTEEKEKKNTWQQIIFLTQKRKRLRFKLINICNKTTSGRRDQTFKKQHVREIKSFMRLKWLLVYRCISTSQWRQIGLLIRWCQMQRIVSLADNFVQCKQQGEDCAMLSLIYLWKYYITALYSYLTYIHLKQASKKGTVPSGRTKPLDFVQNLDICTLKQFFLF